MAVVVAPMAEAMALSSLLCISSWHALHKGMRFRGWSLPLYSRGRM